MVSAFILIYQWYPVGALTFGIPIALVKAVKSSSVFALFKVHSPLRSIQVVVPSCPPSFRGSDPHIPTGLTHSQSAPGGDDPVLDGAFHADTAQEDPSTLAMSFALFAELRSVTWD